jgi:Tfp pilus assembly protein PilV
MKYSHEQGFALIEVVVVVGLVGLAIFGVIGLAAQNVRLSRFALEETQASYLLEEGAEAVKAMRDENWASIEAFDTETLYYLDFNDGSWTATTVASTIGIFTRTVKFSEVYRDNNDDIALSGTVDNQTRLVTVNVEWASGGKSISQDLQLYITDFFTD